MIRIASIVLASAAIAAAFTEYANRPQPKRIERQRLVIEDRREVDTSYLGVCFRCNVGSDNGCHYVQQTRDDPVCKTQLRINPATGSPY
jgi:hypothetical protein